MNTKAYLNKSKSNQKRGNHYNNIEKSCDKNAKNDVKSGTNNVSKR